MKMSPMSEISSISSSTSTTAQRRKIKKPLIEKRRRLRINQSLANLKSLVLEATKKDENCFPKMEKADILEMTVSYMKTMNHRLPTTSCPASLDSEDQLRTYLSGFQECAMQVCSFLMDESTLSVGGAELCSHLSRHLSGCFNRMKLDRRQNQSGDDWRRRTSASSFLRSSSESSVEGSSAREKKFSCDDQPFPSSPSSEKPSASPPVAFPPLLPPLSVTSSSTNFKIETQRNTGAPFTPSSLLLRGHESAAKTTSQSTLQAFNSLTRFASNNHSTVPPQTSSLVQQHPSCVSPKKGDDFPMANAILPSASSSSSTSVAVGLSISTLNPYNHITHREVFPPAADSISSNVWRPW